MTIGIILAAGVGSRLRPMTNDKPKCLVSSADKAILQYQLDSYIAADVRDIYIVVGYEGNAIKEYCKHIADLNIVIIDNPIYEDTNNMYSLYLTKEFADGKEFVLNNADLTVPSELVSRMLADSRPDLVAADVGYYTDESMKISVANDEYIVNIAKDIQADDSLGCSIDFYKFSRESSQTFFAEISNIIEQEENLKDWTEVAMQRLFRTQELKFQAIDINGMPWVEIDNYEDLAVSDKIFSQLEKSILDYKHLVLDLDGTVFVGDQILPGAVESIARLRSLNKGISFLSNNSSRSKSDYVKMLRTFGIELEEHDIVLSTDATLRFLEAQKVKKVYVLGTQSLEDIVTQKGFELSTVDPEFVVVGYDTELTYEKLRIACRLINSNIDFVATHCDLVCPTPTGPVPDVGLLVAMIEGATGRAPYRTFGKPNVETIDDICDANGLSKADVLMVGDRLYTDIQMAFAAGIDSLLVLTGDTAREEIENSEVKPTYVLNSISDIF